MEAKTLEGGYIMDIGISTSYKLTNEDKLNQIIKWFNEWHDLFNDDEILEAPILKEDPERLKVWQEWHDLNKKHSVDYKYISSFIKDNYDTLVADDKVCQILFLMYYRWQTERLRLCAMPKLY